MFPNLRLFLLRFFIVVQEINYPSCFIVYYEIKKEKSVPSRYFVNHTAYPVLSERIRRVSVCAVSSFVDTSENNAKKLVSTTGESFSPWVGLYGIWIVSQITQNQVRLVRNTETLTLFCESLKVGCDWLFRPQTTDNRI